jgi:hypothetical protein
MVRDQGVGGSNPLSPTDCFLVRSGYIGNRTFRRHGLHFWPEGVLQGLQGFFLQINIAQIVIRLLPYDSKDVGLRNVRPR